MKIKTAYCILNHQLTENQKNELMTRFGVSEIVYPSMELSEEWAQVKTTKMIDRQLIRKVIDWLGNASEGDPIVVQGEFGCTFAVVDWALNRGLIPLHAVTMRVESETYEGETVTKHYVFKHCCFRKYECIEANIRQIFT